MRILSGTSSVELSSALAAELEAELCSRTIERFPDDECYVRIDDDLTGQEVVLVSNSHPDRNIVELLLLVDAIRNFDVKGLTLVIPYFGYARQDKAFKPGEVVSARSMARRIGSCCDRALTVDLHEKKIIDWLGCPGIDVTAMDAIGRFLHEKGVELIISPDEGARELVRVAAKAAGVSCDHMVKHRLDANNVRMELKSLDVRGKCICIVDDMISTGGTIRKAAKSVYEQGADRVMAACTHGLFTNDSLTKLEDELDGIFSTDTLKNPSSVISVAETLAKALKHTRDSGN